MKQQNSSTIQPAMGQKPKSHQQIRIADIQVLLLHAPTLECPLPEKLKTLTIQFCRGKKGSRGIIPPYTVFSEQEIIQGCPFQYLLCATAPVVVFSFVINRCRAGSHIDFEIILTP